MVKERRYECKFCGSRFVHEHRFIKHECKQMKRDKEFRTPLGQTAWTLYQEWMKVHRRQVPRADSFLHSKFYRSFLKFAQFVKNVHLPEPKNFIWLMKEKDVEPVLWATDGAYALYLEFIDRKGDPMQQAKTTIDTLEELSDELQVDIEEVFNHLTSPEVVQLLRQRRLSPWLILHSRKFQRFCIEASGEDRTILEAVIRPKYWTHKFQTNPEVVRKMRTYVAALKL